MFHESTSGVNKTKQSHPETQETMRDSLPCEDVRTLNTSHSMFLSALDALVTHLDDIA
ncbi:hypothetical protein [Halostagnicola kamekurae]|uniref:hypothetical protein n=1 Tax=Halostagnicola kamekurae TaxID=619731 RepID=UPI0015877A82|nr:hypothetical protein [Halostagnicola kamekurae]